MEKGLIDGKMLKMGSRHTSCENPNEGPESGATFAKIASDKEMHWNLKSEVF